MSFFTFSFVCSVRYLISFTSPFHAIFLLKFKYLSGFVWCVDTGQGEKINIWVKNKKCMIDRWSSEPPASREGHPQHVSSNPWLSSAAAAILKHEPSCFSNLTCSNQLSPSGGKHAGVVCWVQPTHGIPFASFALCPITLFHYACVCVPESM